MTQDEFGLYGYIVAIIGTFSLAFNLGIYTAQSKLYHEYTDKEKRGVMLSTLNLMLLGFMVLLCATILVTKIDYTIIGFLFKNPFDYNKYRSTIFIAVVVSVYSLMLVNFFLTSEDLRKVQIFNICRVILINIVVLAALWMNRSGDAAFIRLQYSNIIELLIVAVFILFYISKMKMGFDKTVAIKALKIGLPILASAVLGIFINLSDRYFLEKSGSLRDLSIYNTALSVAGVVPFVFASFQNIWLPQFLKERDLQTNRNRSKKMVVRLLLLLLSISVIIFIALKLMLVINIIDKKYDDVLPLLPIVLITSIVTSLTTMFSNHLVYLDKLSLIIFTGVPIAVLSIILNSTLVPAFNVYGAAFSTLALNTCYLISYALLSQHFYNKKLTNLTSAG